MNNMFKHKAFRWLAGLVGFVIVTAIAGLVNQTFPLNPVGEQTWYGLCLNFLSFSFLVIGLIGTFVFLLLAVMGFAAWAYKGIE
jgi:hypothetical protein